MLILAVQSAHDTGIFDLDGDANGNGAGFPDDWEEIYDEWVDGTGNPETDIFAFIAQSTEAPDVDVSYFKGGGSKDVNDVDEWLWEVTDVTPDKDDILNAFAAAYVLDHDICYDLGGTDMVVDCPAGTPVHFAGDIMIYFGMDRFDNNGSAEVAFWFFGQDVALVAEDETNTGGSFTGVHTDHDILVLSDFVIGGKISDVDVYRWDPNVQKNLALISPDGGDCQDADAGDYACGTVSQSPAPTSPWSITPKDLPIGLHSPGLFYEGGINYTRLIGVENVGCLSSFMAETRSSHSVDAQLKDFALGEFPFCDISITKEGPPLAKVGDDVTYEYTIENNGAITLYLTSVIDDVVGDLTSDAEGAGCGTLASGGSCYFEVTTTIGTSNAGGGEDTAVTNVVEAIYNSASDDSGDSVTDDDDHMVNLFEPSISFDKTGDGGPSKVGDTVNYTLTLNNTSSSDSPDLDCNIVDGLLGIDEDVMLASGANHVINKGYVVPQDPPDPLLNIAYVTCSPLGFTNILMDNDNHSVDLFQPAIDVDKTGDELSKVGDSVDYTITLSNNSSAGTPALNCVANDSLMGEVFNGVLPAGDTVLTPSYTVQQGDPDPLVNTVTLTCSPDGFPNILEASDGHSTNLFQAAIDADKTGDDLSKVGDSVDYTITLSNNSSADTPAMSCTATDSLLGEVFNGVLPLGDTVLTPSRVVQQGDPDPLVNTVTLNCSPDGFPNELEASDDHSTNLFQAAIDADKTGDTLSKVGDDVNYTITLSNNSSADTPAMNCIADDSLLGEVFNGVLPLGDTLLYPSRTVQQGDPDPLVNTVTLTCSPAGFTNVLQASDGHSTNLFQAAIDADKTGDALSKVGDEVDYTITLSNNSSADTPAMSCTATDSLLGEVFNGVLPLGDTVLYPSRVVQQGDPDPLVNTVTLTCSPDGFPNILEASDGHSTNLFQPGFNLTLACDVFGVVAGQDVVYRATLNNTSSADSPDLLPNEGASSRTIEFDPPIGANVPIAVSAFDPLPTLSYGDSLQVTFRGASTTAGDFIGTLFAQYAVDGFGNVLTDSDFSTCNAAPAIGRIFIEKLMLDSEDYDFDFPVEIDSVPVTTISLFPEFNSTDKVLSPIPPLPNFDNTVNGFDRQNSALEIDVGTVSDTQDVVIDETPVQVGTRLVSLECTDGTSDPATYNGTEATITVGFDDDITCRWVNEALFEIDLLKTFNSLANSAVDQPFAVYEGPDGFGGSAIASDNTLGDGDGLLEFGNIQLASHQVFTFCELGIPVGTTSMWWVDTGGGLMAITPYNPDSPIEDLGNRCIDFGNLTDDFAAGEVEVGPGDTLHVVIDNITPQGDARTPGYWKNWSSCSNGNQFEKAAAEYEANGAGNFGSEPPRHISLDEALYVSKTVGDLVLYGDEDGNPYDMDDFNDADCEEAVLILSHRDLSGKNRAYDPAAKLARSLLAYLLNIEAGAGTCTEAENATTDGQSLLDSIGFDGTTSGYFGKGKAAKDDPLYHEATELAGILDTYNNNNLCP
ncbi:hypothetical protein [Porticoccus sp.]